MSLNYFWNPFSVILFYVNIYSSYVHSRVEDMFLIRPKSNQTYSCIKHGNVILTHLGAMQQTVKSIGVTSFIPLGGRA